MRKFYLGNRKVLILLGILLIAAFFRFHRFEEFLSFGMDQEYEAFLVKNIIDLKHFPLIGVNASDTGIYLGPFFIYLASIPFAIFKGNPLGWGLVASLWGIITAIFIYKIGTRMFDNNTGILAAFFYSGSFLVSFYDRQFWNPMTVPLISLLLGYFIYRLLKDDNRSILWVAILLGLSLHLHLSLLIFLPLIIYALVKKRKIFDKKKIFISFAIFFLFLSPLVIFDLRHGFTNIKGVISTVTGHNINNRSSLGEKGKLIVSTLGRFVLLPPMADLSIESGQCKEMNYLRKNSLILGLTVLFITFLIFNKFLNKQKNKTSSKTILSLKIILFIFVSTTIFVLFYQREIYEYYFLYLFPWLAIILGWGLSSVFKPTINKYVVTAILLIFVTLNIFSLISAGSSYPYPDKLKAILFVRERLKGESYRLEALGECPRFGGYRYLFGKYASAPSKSYMESYFAWLYPDELKNSSSYTVLLSLIDHRMDKKLITKWEEDKMKYLSRYSIDTISSFGNIEVIILKSRLNDAIQTNTDRPAGSLKK